MDRQVQRILNESLHEDKKHIPFEEEFAFYRRIQEGDLSVLEGDMGSTPSEGMGTLSTDFMRNSKYHLIILTALITRFCIEGGLDSETAYTISDYYIRLIDNARDKGKLSQIKTEIITQFTTTMHRRNKQSPYSLPVTKATEYIHTHLTETIHVKDIARALNYTPDHLSRLFKQETGYSLSHYILVRKCQSACYMLENSTASCTDIGAALGFSSCSHFISRFKRMIQMTPQEYRNSKARNQLSSTSASI